MKIGEFAKMCGTRISVLRHYDREGLLEPLYTDRFSGYRYYGSEQILTYHRINALKKAGFSLQKIREIISDERTDKEIDAIFSHKEKQFLEALKNLKEARLMMTRLNIVFEEGKAVIKAPADTDTAEICAIAETQLKAADYQRVSQYRRNNNEICCDVVKLDGDVEPPEEDLPFVNDERVVGKWEIIGIYAVREDFYGNLFPVRNFYGEEQKYLYFLPGGERYWAFSWTKGYLNTPYNNEYETEEIGEDLYMFVSLKEYEYTRGGKPSCLVLKKADSKHYTPKELARKDDINKPFVNDERVLGKWTAHSFLGYLWDKNDFPTEREPIEELYFKELCFFPDGRAKCVYEDAVFEGEDTVAWTKNYLLRKWNRSACEYEIRTVDGIEYLIIEWKSGDWRYGGYDTNYYVFTKN